MIKLTKIIPSFPVHKIETAVNFYVEKFGFSCPHRDNSFAILIRDNIELHLWAACDRSWKWRSLLLFIRPIWSGAESFLAGTHSCRIEVDNIKELYDELKANQVLYSPKTIITTTDWGTKEFAALDLHGNLLTFYEKME